MEGEITEGGEMRKRKGNEREENWIILQIDAKREAGGASRATGELAVLTPFLREIEESCPDHREGL